MPTISRRLHVELDEHRGIRAKEAAADVDVRVAHDDRQQHPLFAGIGSARGHEVEAAYARELEDARHVVAERMDLPEIKPEWVGANLFISGIPQLSMLPAGTMLFFKGGVTLKVDAQNGPCRIAGRSIAENAKMPDHDAASLLFPKVAKRLRGVVAWVEKPGAVANGEDVSVRIPEQWIYR